MSLELSPLSSLGPRQSRLADCDTLRLIPSQCRDQQWADAWSALCHHGVLTMNYWDKKCRNHPWHVHCWGGYECIYRKQNFDIPTEFISTTLWDCINISMGPNLAQSMFCHVVDRFGLFHWSSENKQFWVETGDHRENLLITLQAWLGREMIAVCVSQGTKCRQSSGHLQGHLKRISELLYWHWHRNTVTNQKIIYQPHS